MITSPLHVLLLGAYESFTVELIAACAELPFPVQFHRPAHQSAQSIDGPDRWLDAPSVAWAWQVHQQVAAPAVLIYGDAPAVIPPLRQPEELRLPVLVLGATDAHKKRVWETAGVAGCLSGAVHHRDDLIQALVAIYTAETAAREASKPDTATEIAPVQTVLFSEMSHEIRTPLTTILGFAEILAHSTEGEQQMLASMIVQGGKRLADIVNSVLDLARVDAGQQSLQYERVDVVAEVAEVVSFFVPQAMEKSLRLRVEPPNTPTWADVDVTMLQRIVNNLVGNAVKFTDAGHVHVAVTATEAALTLTVNDTGTGIEATFLPELFNAFRQGASSHRQIGSGLGLAITQRLVHLAGGTINVSSQRGGGTTFTVVLPRFADSPRLPRSIVQRMAAVSGTPGTSPTSPLTPGASPLPMDMAPDEARSDAHGSLLTY